MQYSLTIIAFHKGRWTILHQQPDSYTEGTVQIRVPKPVAIMAQYPDQSNDVK